MNRHLFTAFWTLFSALTAAVISYSPSVYAEDTSAVVLVYHRFGEDSIPSTNIRLEQFGAQLKYLAENDFQFLPLDQIITRLKSGQSVPTKTIAITVDDAYRSALIQAWPRLKAAGIPLTLFVSTDPVDAGTRGYMSWDEIRLLQADGVLIAHHGAAHIHMPHAGLQAAKADMERASARFKAELGMVPKLFAFPYGEYNPALMQMIEDMGFTAAFAQISGAAGASGPFYALPRFPINENYGTMDRFKLVAATKALPLRDVIPKSPVIEAEHNPPLLGFTVTDSKISLKNMQCYPSHLGKAANLVQVGDSRYEVRFDKPFPKGRNRINCTARDRDGRWFWFGKFFLVPGGKLD